MPDRETVIKAIDICLGHGKCKDCGYHSGVNYSDQDCRGRMLRDAIALLKESVPQGVVDQIRWERDTALSQLEQIGKGLGSKMDDIVDLLKEHGHKAGHWATHDGEWCCDQCGYEPMIFEGTPFCPNCGVKMESW